MISETPMFGHVKVRAIRRGAGLSQAQLAAILGVSQGLVAAWESATRVQRPVRYHHVLTLLELEQEKSQRLVRAG